MNKSDQTTNHYDLRFHGDPVIGIVEDTHGQIDHRVLQVVSQSDVAPHARGILGAWYCQPRIQGEYWSMEESRFVPIRRAG